MKTFLPCLFFLLILVGCAQRPTPPATKTADWAAHQQQLNDLTDWSLRGKIAIITPENRHSLNIYWQQSGDNFHITLTSFLGSTILDVKKTALSTRIIDDQGKIYFGKNTQTLMTRLSGIELPVEVLQQWIKGNPIGAVYQLNENNQLVSLTGQDNKNENWSANYQDYKTVQEISLPHQLKLTRQDLLIKFAIQKWLLEKTEIF
ncbi:outer membrane lipoprotein LolB [Psychromonas ingrahamii 37]|uniref:Outer-membrane lipoprotein LolB n=1 Tax=Psychromonas ingrahamii (strain DSM 17664 / CCUG 51855 / 37) TaxID=357804 RepID=LOLB_PSYIN|nr:lipoprotein insertase outer membrane protein LolB [Psychromonas ingrahamii]A1STE0.1 RecName: Full=Outer-membrane lipoprotein LolB; Flags: Precursor [Psychromonas ingrahamii 37]ABM02755.1 outer membrane lipoprotein LolB [Psychromonas ingrahamii 37]